MTNVVNINDVLDGHMSLEIECIDRLHLNAYVPNLQVGGQVVRFLVDHPLHRWRLAGAVGAEQREHLALGHRQVDPADRWPSLVGLVQSAYLDGRP